MISRRAVSRLNRGRFAVGRGFSPTQIGGGSLVLWLRADRGVTKDGSDLVATWADQSGVGNNVTQATGTAKPTWIADGIGGQPALSFDGDDHLATAADNVYAQPGTWAIVIRTGNPLATVNVVDSDNAGARNAVYHTNAGAVRMFAGTDVAPAGTTVAAATNYMLLTVFNGASSFARLNGTQSANVNPGAQGATGFTIGSSAPKTGSFVGRIAEVMRFTAALSAGDMSTLENYFRARYGL